jgi:hypothetical protein
MALAQHVLQRRGGRAMRAKVKQNLQTAISNHAAMCFGVIMRADP